MTFESLIMELESLLERCYEELSRDEILLLSSGHVIKEGNDLFIVFNDTWGWALAAGRTIPREKIKEVADLYRDWGYAGLLYWETKQPNGFTQSEFKDINRFIEYVRKEEELREKVPDSNKRAYMDI